MYPFIIVNNGKFQYDYIDYKNDNLSNEDKRIILNLIIKKLKANNNILDCKKVNNYNQLLLYSGEVILYK